MPTDGERIIAADDLGPRWSRYSAMLRDTEQPGPDRGDGVLRLEGLEWYIDRLQIDRNAALRDRESTQVIDMRLRESMEMLGDMKRAGVTGLFYLPPQFDGVQLTPSLRQRITELLMHDDQDKTGRISQGLIDRARTRYYNLPQLSAHTVFVRERALNEIGDIAHKLGLI